MERDRYIEILKELDRLIILHEKNVSDPGACRVFNSQASLLLERLEEMEVDDLADRVMDLLAGCSPKDFSPCDNRMNAKASLERLRERVSGRID